MTAAFQGSVIETEGDADRIEDRINAISLALDAGRRSLEMSCFTTGEKLIKCLSDLHRVTKIFESLPSRLDCEEVTQAIHAIESANGAADMAVDAFSERNGRIDPILAVTAEVAAPIQKMAGIVQTIEFVAINARIAAAEFSESEDDFSVFTSDIVRISEKASKTIGQFLGVYTQLVTVLKAKRGEMAQFESAYSRSLSALVRHLSNGLAAVAEQKRKSVSASIEIGHLVGQIAANLSEIVQANQIGDISCQRFAHVEQTLGALLDECPGSSSRNEKIALTEAICRVQAAQLTEALRDLDREIAKIVAGLRGLVSGIKAVVRRSREICGMQENGCKKSALAELGAHLDAVCGVLKNCEAADRELHGVCDTIAASFEDMFHHVGAMREIESDMRLVSFNMTLKCAHLGERGRTLGVISDELRALTGEMIAHVNHVIRGLEGATALSRAFFDDESSGSGTIKLAQLEERARTSLRLLEDVDVSLTDAVASLVKDGNAVADILDKEASKISAQLESGAPVLKFAQETVSEIANLEGGTLLVGASADAVVNERVLRILNGGGRHSMASERLIQTRALGIEIDDVDDMLPTKGADDIDDMFL